MFIATEPFTAGINYGVAEFAQGDHIDADLGRQLLAMGCPVQEIGDTATGTPTPKPRGRARKSDDA